MYFIRRGRKGEYGEKEIALMSTCIQSISILRFLPPVRAQCLRV